MTLPFQFSQLSTLLMIEAGEGGSSTFWNIQPLEEATEQVHFEIRDDLKKHKIYFEYKEKIDSLEEAPRYAMLEDQM